MAKKCVILECSGNCATCTAVSRGTELSWTTDRQTDALQWLL